MNSNIYSEVTWKASDSDGRYEADYTDFTLTGTYILNIFAQDTQGAYSLPRQIRVTRTDGTPIYTIDGYVRDGAGRPISSVVMSGLPGLRPPTPMATTMAWCGPAGPARLLPPPPRTA